MAGVVPVSADKKKVLLIQSTRRKAWVLPKGGWEKDEATAEEAACREAWEEAGIVCRCSKELGFIQEPRSSEEIANSHHPMALYHFFEVVVDQEAPTWPEGHKRSRAWMSYSQAVAALNGRTELVEALNRSSIIKT